MKVCTAVIVFATGAAMSFTPANVLATEGHKPELMDGPDPVPWCNWCFECAENRVSTWENPDGMHVLGVEMQCESYDCSDLINCRQEEEQDEDALAAITLLLQQNDLKGLRTFLAANPQVAEVIPERNLLVVRGGCTGEAVIALRSLSASQTGSLTPWVDVAFQED